MCALRFGVYKNVTRWSIISNIILQKNYPFTTLEINIKVHYSTCRRDKELNMAWKQSEAHHNKTVQFCQALHEFLYSLYITRRNNISCVGTESS